MPFTTSYQPLCRVVMRHAYFTDGSLRELATAPTPATAERLRRAGLLFRSQADGFVVLCTSAGLPPVALQSVFPLVFSLVPRDPYFANYSDLPLLVGPAHTYCLGPPAEAGSLALQTGAVVGAADQLPLRPLVFRQPVPAATDLVLLSRYPGGPVLQQLVVPAGASAIALDLRPWGSGRYHLQIGSELVLFYADDYLAVTRPWGLLTLDATVLATPGVSYTLSFAARPTYWQYNLVARRLPLPSDLSITTGTTLSFIEVPAPLGVTASWLATQAQSLAQRYHIPPYQLVLPAAAGRAQILLPALPQAGPASLRQKNNGISQQLVSDLFVQL